MNQTTRVQSGRDFRSVHSDALVELRETQSVAAVGSWRHGSSSVSHAWSDEAYRLLGYDPDRVRAAVGRVLRRVHPEDRNRVVDAIRNAISQGLSLMLVFRVQWPSGEIRFLRVRGRHDVAKTDVWRGTIQDITDSKRAEQERDLMFDQVCAGRERMQALSQRLLQVQEVERREIARDLHDEIGQGLTALRMSLEAVVQSQSPGAAPKQLTDSLEVVDQMLHHVRDLALDLRPSMLDDLGLVDTLKWYVARQGERYGLAVSFQADRMTDRPQEYVEVACFRVAQEALTNVARHAQAKRVSIRLHRSAVGLLDLDVEDDGIGFDPVQARSEARGGQSVGLLGMEERARLAGGTLVITSKAGHGTTVKARFPVEANRSIDQRRKPR